MEITRLRYFCAVAETESVRRAAALLRISPGALSKALAQTEELAGSALFARAGRTLSLTDAGRQFHARAAKVIAEYDALTAPPAAPSLDRPLRIGSFEVFTTHLLGEIATQERRDLPLTVLELVPGRIEDAVARDEVDFGITYAPVATAGVEFLPLGDLTMGIFGLASRWRGVRFEELVFAVPITPVGGHIAGLQSLDGWPTSAPRRTIRYWFELLETALILARQGHCVLHCPSFVVRLANRSARPKMRLVPLPLPGRMKSIGATVYIAKRASEPETRRLRAWARLIRRVLASEG